MTVSIFHALAICANVAGRHGAAVALEAINVAARSNFLAEAILFSRLPAKLGAYVSSHSVRSYT